MGPAEILAEIQKTNPQQESLFSAIVVLTSILIIFLGILTWIIIRYLNDDKQYKKDTTEVLTELKTAILLIREEQKYHRKDIDKNSDDIGDLKKRRR